MAAAPARSGALRGGRLSVPSPTSLRASIQPRSAAVPARGCPSACSVAAPARARWLWDDPPGAAGVRATGRGCGPRRPVWLSKSFGREPDAAWQLEAGDHGAVTPQTGEGDTSATPPSPHMGHHTSHPSHLRRSWFRQQGWAGTGGPPPVSPLPCPWRRAPAPETHFCQRRRKPSAPLDSFSFTFLLNNVRGRRGQRRPRHVLDVFFPVMVQPGP